MADKRRRPWEPLHPDFALNPDGFRLERGRYEADRKDKSSVPWEPAPSFSHVAAFRYVRGENGESPVIQVRFKPKGRKPMTQYSYFPADRREANRIFELLLDDPHPGTVVHDILIAEQILYQRNF